MAQSVYGVLAFSAPFKKPFNPHLACFLQPKRRFLGTSFYVIFCPLSLNFQSAIYCLDSAVGWYDILNVFLVVDLLPGDGITVILLAKPR